MRRIYHYHTIDFIVALNESKMKFPRFLKVLSHPMITRIVLRIYDKNPLFKCNFNRGEHREDENIYETS